MNGFAETVVKILKRECLDHFTEFGPAHLGYCYLLREFSVFSNQHRPQRNLGNRPLTMAEPTTKDASNQTKQRLSLG